MNLLTDLTLSEFAERLSGDDAAPGGGSASALAGLLGTSLSLMTAKLSFGRKAYDALGEETREAFKADFSDLGILYGELRQLVDDDSAAYVRVMEAFKMPKDTDGQILERSREIAEAKLGALMIPLRVAEKCLDILRRQSVIASCGNRNAASDIGVGALLAYAGLEGALLNVKTNLTGIADSGVARRAAESAELYAAEGAHLKNKIIETVTARMN